MPSYNSLTRDCTASNVARPSGGNVACAKALAPCARNTPIFSANHGACSNEPRINELVAKTGS